MLNKLVALGHSQDYDIDYEEVFAPAVRNKDTIRTLYFNDQRDVRIFQMDVMLV